MRLPVTNQPGCGQPAMGGDEIRPHDAVAVEKDAVVAARGQDRAVADFAGAKSAIFVPDMLEAVAEFGLPGLDQLAGDRGRAVVGHHDLEIAVGLARQRAQHRRERILAVIGGDDDGNQLGHGRPNDRLRMILSENRYPLFGIMRQCRL